MGPSQSQIDKIELKWSDYIPAKPTAKQLGFLLLMTREAFYGGAGGGGKSYALLMAALQYVDYPEYAALLLRRTYKDLTKPGALMDIAQSWLGPSDARWSDREATWHFPSGATLSFGYLDNESDKWQYQGGSYQFIGWDELTQFYESYYRFLFGWNRRPANSAIPLRIRAASNPGGVGHDWVKQRFIVEPNADRVFMPARLKDNPHIDQESYIQSLMELDPVTRAQILEGDWSAREAGSKFRREWFQIVDVAPSDLRKVRFWDMAATEPKKGKDPDWTAGCLMGISSNQTLYIVDMKRIRTTPSGNEQLIKQMAELEGREVPVRMEQEPGSSGVGVIDDYRRRVLMGWDFKGIPSTGSKEVRANPLASQAEAGNIKLVRGPWINAFLDEVESFPGGAHDDQVDAMSGAFGELVVPRSNISMAVSERAKRNIFTEVY